jgi:hypothetical protein
MLSPWFPGTCRHGRLRDAAPRGAIAPQWRASDLRAEPPMAPGFTPYVLSSQARIHWGESTLAVVRSRLAAAHSRLGAERTRAASR